MSTKTASKVSLRRLYDGETITLKATNGNGTFAQSADIYTGYLDSDFENWGLNVPGKPAGALNVAMSEMYEEGGNGTFAEIFATLGNDLDKLRLPQEQAKNFAIEHRDKLHPDGWATFILFTKGDEPVKADKSNLFVAFVYDLDRERKAGVREFSNDDVWRGGGGHRVVYPQQ